MRPASRNDGAFARRAGALILGVGALGLAALGCSAATRHRILSAMFDGVPPPRSAAAEGPTSSAGAADATPARPAAAFDHGPFAARMCSACHDSEATNALILPREQLCFRCHELTLAGARVHGPIASGGCLVCHDPHSSRNAALLVSESAGICMHCHERGAIDAIPSHDGLETGCTDCHDAHASGKQYLLK